MTGGIDFSVVAATKVALVVGGGDGCRRIGSLSSSSSPGKNLLRAELCWPIGRNPGRMDTPREADVPAFWDSGEGKDVEAGTNVFNWNSVAEAGRNGGGMVKDEGLFAAAGSLPFDECPFRSRFPCFSFPFL